MTKIGLNGNMIAVSDITLHRTWLLLEWLTVCGKVKYIGV